MKNNRIYDLLGVIFFISGVGCATRSLPPAPIVNATQVPSYAAPTVVATQNPSAATAAANASAAPKLAAVNNSDNEVQTTPAGTKNTASNVVVSDAAAPMTTQVAPPSGQWQMPTSGTLGQYNSKIKGVNILGSEGQDIYAAAGGKVLYSGNGLKGYGNLIIIKHDNTYLSAYAYNKANLVKEGASVQKGQKIATMGVDESSKAMLHFEVRKNGKPIDPHLVLGN